MADKRYWIIFALGVALLQPPAVIAGEFSAEIEVGGRNFFEPAIDKRQYTADAFAKLRMEYYHDWNKGDTRFVMAPTGRILQGEDEYTRTDGDLEEFYIRHTIGSHDFYFGSRKLFWGVTESVHLVDVINQTDLVEDVDGEDRLGQPMVQWSSQHMWGTLDVIMMPYFRERRFPDVEGRLRPPLPVSDDALYESPDEENHIDAAIRWSHFIGDWDIGVAHFSGTAREPMFVPEVNAQGNPELRPFYPLLEQTSIDLQATKGGWLWKLEVASREQLDTRNTRLAGGFEFSFYGVAGTDADLGMIAEYLFDDADDRATTPFEDDVFIGARLAFNDVQGSEILAGVIVDREDNARALSIEASRRIGDSWTIDLTARFFSNAEAGDVLYGIRRDDFAMLSMTKYF